MHCRLRASLSKELHLRLLFSPIILSCEFFHRGRPWFIRSGLVSHGLIRIFSHVAEHPVPIWLVCGPASLVVCTIVGGCPCVSLRWEIPPFDVRGSLCGIIHNLSQFAEHHIPICLASAPTSLAGCMIYGGCLCVSLDWEVVVYSMRWCP